MVEILIVIPVMIFSGIFQATLLSRINLLSGNADLILLILIVWSLNPHTRYSWVWYLTGALVMSYLSALPLYGYFIIYGLVWLFIHFLKTRFWQMPMILMMFVTIVGSILTALVSYAILFINDIALDPKTILTQVTIPSLTLNLLMAIPVFGIVNDWANVVCQKEAEV